MRIRLFRRVLFLFALLFLLAFPRLGRAENRALLVGCDVFRSLMDTSPSSSNNVAEMAEALSGGSMNLETLVTRRYGVSGARELTNLIQETFADAREGDVSYFYISTHGLWEPGEPGYSMTMLLSDGRTESGITAQQLHDAFAGIAGTKVLIVDACHAGAMIAKGIRDEFSHIFEGSECKVICSSGGAEESWFWRGGMTEDGEMAGGGYFSGVLSAGISVRTGYAADENRDGCITLKELVRYLLNMHGSSTVHVYPEQDDFPVLTYHVSSLRRQTEAVGNISFESDLLTADHMNISFSFTVYAQVQVSYQIVYQRGNRWDFENARILYDTDEYYGRAGYLSPGYKERTLTIAEDVRQLSGYVLFQMVGTDAEGVRIVASRAIGRAASEEGELSVQVRSRCAPGRGEEMGFVVSHTGPAEVSAVIETVEGESVCRLASRQLSRPEQIYPEGTTLYWDGKLRNGEPAGAGLYRLRVTVYGDGFEQETVSDVFELM